MDVFKIVLTGGPCAGKSKILERLIKYYSTEENKIFVVPETATEVLSSGIKFLEIDEAINFQDIIFDRQLNKEQTLYRGMQHILLKKINIVFLDRGLIDNKAYLNSQYQFDNLLDKYAQKELKILDSYDLVIDLISLATTDPKLYLEQAKSNKERYEDLETAQIIDKKTTEAWLGHRNIKYVYPTNTLKEKSEILIGYINDLLTSRQNKDVETFLIENPIDILLFLDDENSKKIEVIDYYLNKSQSDRSNTKTILRKRIYKTHESKQIIIISEDGLIKTDRVISDSRWNFFETTCGVEKVVEKVEYTTNKLGGVCKITCYNDFTTLEIPKTNCKTQLDILKNFKVIERIDDFETFYDKRNKNIPKIKKYGNI